jgi:hypothetical protein
MDAILMASGLHPTEEELLHHEMNSLKSSLAAETERVAHMGAEIARLHVVLNETSLACSGMHQVCLERDELQKQVTDHLTFKREPLEAQLADANRALFEQRVQLRSIVDAMAMQRDWMREWAVQCQENMRLRDRLAHREAGTEVEELRRQMLDMHAKFADLHMSFKQRGVTVALLESKHQSVVLENNRLTSDVALHKEQLRRLWKRVVASQATSRSEKQAAARALQKVAPPSSSD